MPKSFAELEVAENVTYEELAETLKDYAETGAAIKGSVVVGIIQKMSLTSEQRGDLFFYAEIGVINQERRGFTKDALEYLKVIRAL